MHVEVAKGIRLMISESVRFFSNADMYQLEIIGPFKHKIHLQYANSQAGQGTSAAQLPPHHHQTQRHVLKLAVSCPFPS